MMMTKFVNRLALFIAVLIVPVMGTEITSTNLVGPGVWHTHTRIPEVPWDMHIMTIDLQNPYITLESSKGEDQLFAREGTSSAAARKSYPGHRVIGAVNGDFYNVETGEPINAQIVNGHVIHRPTGRPTFAVSSDSIPFIEYMSMSGVLVDDSGAENAIHGVNQSRNTDQLVMFNDFYGATTATNEFGTEVVCTLVSEPLVNDTVRVVVMAKNAGAGNAQIPDDELVFSGHGVSAAFLNDQVAIGDTLRYLMRFSGVNESVLVNAIGGNPIIVQNGSPVNDDGIRHPRTSVGWDESGRYLYFFVVDGRQAGLSLGVTLGELGQLMAERGVYRGLNLDGGGSSTFVIQGQIKNSPSDGGERRVSNHMLVVSSAPIGALDSLAFITHERRVFQGGNATFPLRAYDQYGNPLVPDTLDLNWGCDAGIGSITPDGVFTAGTVHDSGYVYVSSTDQSTADSVFVTIDVPTELAVSPRSLILRMGETQPIQLNMFDTGGNRFPVQADNADWTVPTALLTQNGAEFTAIGAGEGWLVAQYMAVVGSCYVAVEVDSANLVLEDFETGLDLWELDGTEMDMFTTRFLASTEFPGTAKLRYKFTRSGGSSVVSMQKDILVSGSPDYLTFRFRGNGYSHTLMWYFTDIDNELFRLLIPYSSSNTDWQTITLPWNYAQADWSNPGAQLTFPITFHHLDVYLGGGDVNETIRDSIYFDDLAAEYFMDVMPEGPVLPTEFKLTRVYPNPFNAATRIEFQVPPQCDVELAIYDITGRKVWWHQSSGNLNAGLRSLIWQGVDMQNQPVASGVYFLQLRSNGQQINRKLLMMK
ncbi:MAG: phosphodiester glycosidase family protein [Lentisphaeria bacterium]|nr:phosphodiester glycosidase family protein [Candidatus Neomarinimicrobiota bacterium]MCF7842564.1 phosphodiester glycosidase family protein [Lentisphaeria bacterium]